MIANGCSLVCPSVCPLPQAYHSKTDFLASRRISPLVANVSYLGTRSPWRPRQELKLKSSNGTPLLHLATASTTLSSRDESSLSRSAIPMMWRQQQRPFLQAPRASMDIPYPVHYPKNTEKAKWWWRTLACLPYLISLRDTWRYAETAYRLYPCLEAFEFLTRDFYRAFDRMPRWFVMVYFSGAYLAVVRKKEWPHFLRFHLVMAMLLENALQVIEMVISWLPFAFFGGFNGFQHFWIALGAAYLLTVFVCTRSAVAGNYANIPVVSDAAYIHSNI